ncbi:hypothetical protein BDM02DRAFT_980105 [Thelephora ganbajun]|uniref:Uncharacterized protein n=1 Tax=Thelephora ganbajun TaxID=370292 RepID=A0ACB6ZP14_THEGA|nr:hypothetical protein BDM02DRAFT_980105 [Thelephora ganbajun]
MSHHPNYILFRSLMPRRIEKSTSSCYTCQKLHKLTVWRTSTRKELFLLVQCPTPYHCTSMPPPWGMSNYISIGFTLNTTPVLIGGCPAQVTSASSRLAPLPWCISSNFRPVCRNVYSPPVIVGNDTGVGDYQTTGMVHVGAQEHFLLHLAPPLGYSWRRS